MVYKKRGRPEATSVAGRTLPEEEGQKEKGRIIHGGHCGQKHRDKRQLLRANNLKRKQVQSQTEAKI
jgi:hypothetical protein